MLRRSEHPARAPRRVNQEGMALVLALMVLLVLTVVGAALMANVNTETKISGYKVRDTQALTLAEAGASEAMLRLRNGDIVDDLNPTDTTLIFNQVAGSLPAVPVGFTALPTLQPVGSYLNYSTATRSPYTLKVNYKTKAGVIQRYDDAATPKVNTVSGNPIFVITSTGQQGSAVRTIYAEVCRAKFNILAKGALVANNAIMFKGNIELCGRDHRADTPSQLGPPGCDLWLAGTSPATDMPGAWSSSTVTSGGSSTLQGSVPKRESQPGFYSGPWDALGMTQSDFWSFIGASRTSVVGAPTGIIYLDNDNVKQNSSGSWSFNGGDGEGLLYADGDLDIRGTFNYRGMIYCEGNLSINGNCWILGGLVVKGNRTVKIANGSGIVLYSGDAMQQKISRYGGQVRTIAWREQ